MSKTEATETQAVEEANQGETTQVVETTVDATQAVAETISQDEASKLRRESQNLRRRMHEYEAKAKSEEEAKLSETERLTKQLQEAQAALRQKELTELRLKAARAAGLPEELATFLLATRLEYKPSER